MKMRRTLFLAFSALCLLPAWQRSAHAAPEGSELAGVWEEEVDGFKGVWTLKVDDKGAWTVGSVYTKKGKTYGASKGVDAKYADGALVFTQKFTKLPDLVVWGDGATITIKATGDAKGSLTWDLGGSSGTRPLVKRNGAAATTPGKGDGSELVGAWTDDVGSLIGTWTVSMTKDGLAVSGVYLDKKMQPVGSFTGVNVQYADGALSFDQQFDKKPTGFADGAHITLKYAGNKMVQMQWQAGKASGSRELSAVDK
jgi:hypothetical protein